STLGIMRAGVAMPDDRRIRWLALLASLAALGQHAGRTTRVPAALAAAFATAHRVAHRVLRRAAVMRLAALPALPSRFAQADVHVVGIADGANRGPAFRCDAAHLAARQRDLRPVTFASG